MVPSRQFGDVGGPHLSFMYKDQRSAQRGRKRPKQFINKYENADSSIPIGEQSTHARVCAYGARPGQGGAQNPEIFCVCKSA